MSRGVEKCCPGVKLCAGIMKDEIAGKNSHGYSEYCNKKYLRLQRYTDSKIKKPPSLKFRPFSAHIPCM